MNFLFWHIGLNRRKKNYALVGISLTVLFIAGIVAYYTYSSMPGQVQGSPDPQ